MRRRASFALLAVSCFGLACTWVPMTKEGRTVEVVANSEVTGCERVGATRARVLSRVWFIPRPRAAVNRELDTLAHNEGAKLGGNTVTPLPSRIEGEREYAVYRCDD